MLTILQGDAIEQLRTLPDESVHCCVTSPPYWGLRDYGTAEWEGGEASCDHTEPPRGGRNPETAGKQLTNAGTLSYQFAHECEKCGAKRIDSQLGLEKTQEEYVAKMVEVFREVRRVLRKDGTCWINLGDSIQNKQLQGIPWRVAFALQADGWWLRSDIIWAKPNPMPESVTDRPTKAHEYLFLLTKSANYYYDAEAIKEKSIWADDPRADQGHIDYDGKRDGSNGQGQRAFCSIDSSGRNKRSVWTVATAPYPEAHFATYPPDLIKPCILAGTSAKGCCPQCGAPWGRIIERTKAPYEPHPSSTYITENRQRSKGQTRYDKSGRMPQDEIETIGWSPLCESYDWHGRHPNRELTHEGSAFKPIPCTVLDPFAGSGTTGAVALELGRKAVLIELNPKYVELIKTRCNITPGLQLA